MAATPTHKKLPKSSLEFMAVMMHRTMMKINNAIISMDPRNPNSSETELKTKSVWASGSPPTCS